MALMTADEVQVYLPALAGDAEDTTLDTLIARFDALAAEHLRFPDAPGGVVGASRTLEDSTYTLYIDGPDSQDPRILDLGVYPVVSITSIHADAIRAYGTDALVDSGDYTLFGAEGLVELTSAASSAWATGPRANKAVIVAGWTSIPAAIKHACGLQVAGWWKNRGTVGVRSTSQRGTSVQLRALSLLPSVREALQPFVLMGGCCA